MFVRTGACFLGGGGGVKEHTDAATYLRAERKINLENLERERTIRGELRVGRVCVEGVKIITPFK